jgi:hypothetical protein
VAVRDGVLAPPDRVTRDETACGLAICLAVGPGAAGARDRRAGHALGRPRHLRRLPDVRRFPPRGRIVAGRRDRHARGPSAEPVAARSRSHAVLRLVLRTGQTARPRHTGPTRYRRRAGMGFHGRDRRVGLPRGRYPAPSRRLRAPRSPGRGDLPPPTPLPVAIRSVTVGRAEVEDRPRRALRPTGRTESASPTWNARDLPARRGASGCEPHAACSPAGSHRAARPSHPDRPRSAVFRATHAFPERSSAHVAPPARLYAG